MSQPLQSEENPQVNVETVPSVDPLMSMLNTLIPPESVEIHDVFHNKYSCATSVSARAQIKVMREFDKIKNLDIGSINANAQSIFDTIMKIAVNEEVLETLSRCFALSHPHILKTTIDYADSQNFPYEKGDSAAVDLFALEEIVTAIVPLFLRLARRTGQALQAIGQQAN